MSSPIVAIARSVALVWAGFWLFFFVVESVAWRTPLHVAGVWVAVGFGFLILAFVPWRYEASGGMLLGAVGIALAVDYPLWAPDSLSIAGLVISTISMAAPPVIAGAMFVFHDRSAFRQGRKSGHAILRKI